MADAELLKGQGVGSASVAMAEEAEGVKEAWWGRLVNWISVRAFRKEAAEFYRQVAAGMEGGKSTAKIIADKLATAIQRKRLSVPAYQIILSRLGNKGTTLTQALEGIALELDLAILKPGEQNTSQMISALYLAEKATTARSRFGALVMKAFMRPTMFFLAALGGVYFFGSVVLPEFVGFIGGGKQAVPVVVTSLISFARFLDDYYLLVLLCMTGLVAFAFLSRPYLPRGGVRNVLDHLPPWVFYRASVAGNLIVSLAALTETNTSPAVAISTLKAVGTRYLASHLNESLSRLDSGAPMARALDTGLIPAEITDEIAIRGRPESVQTVLRQLGLEKLEDLDRILVRSLTRWTAMLWTLGGLLFAMMFASYLLMYSGSSNVMV